jgi:hypothetical protein
MKPNPLIEEIREVRHRISAAFGHDTQRLVRHYQELQATRYSDRTFVRSEPQPVTALPPATSASSAATRKA